MVKSITAALHSHLSGTVTSLASCWLIERTDGRQFAFTSLDADLIIAGVTYQSKDGFSRTAISTTSAGQVDNLEVLGYFSPDGITETDLKNGLFNYASVYLFAVNFMDLTQGIIKLRRGWLGECTRSPSGDFKAELRGLSQALTQEFGNIFTPICRADLGDLQCKMPIAPVSWQPNTYYAVGSYIAPLNKSTTALEVAIFKATVAGTSGATEPVWDLSVVQPLEPAATPTPTPTTPTLTPTPNPTPSPTPTPTSMTTFKNSILSWLSAMATHQVVSSQYIMGATAASLTDPNAIYSLTGQYVGALVGNYCNDGGSDTAVITSPTNSLMLQWWNAGGLVAIGGFPPNPSGGGFGNTTVNGSAILTPGTAEYTQWTAIKTAYAAGFKELQNAGAVVIWRPMPEMNGTWFWWGQAITDLQYVAIWKDWQAFNTAYGLENLIYVYASNGGDLTRYPGDAYVDMVGFDAYVSNPDASNTGYSVFTSADTAVGYGATKPIVYAEFGPQGPSAGDPSFDETTLITALKGPLNKCVMWTQWGETSAGPSWAINDTTNASAAMNDAYVWNRGNVANARPVYTATPTPTPIPTAPTTLFTIMPLGDSMTAGGGTAVNGGPPPGAYRAPLYTLLQNGHYNTQFVGDQTFNPGTLPSTQQNHEGIGGYAIDLPAGSTGSASPSMLQYLQANGTLQAYTPNVILLMMGYNNLYSSPPANVGPATAFTYLQNMINDIFAVLPQCKVIVSTEPAVSGDYGVPTSDPTSSSEIGYFNYLILNNLTGAIGNANLSIVDLNHAENSASGGPAQFIGPDGIHPNVAGCQIIANTFYSGIQAAVGTAVAPATPAPTPTNFSVSAGKIYDPSGVLWIGKGINISDSDMASVSTSSANHPLTTLFPGIKIVRVACFDLSKTPSFYATFIADMTAAGIVVVLEDHTNSTGANSGGGAGVVYTGALLTNELAWYTALATANKANPYVWFGTNNEPAYSPSIAALSTWHQQTYDAIRGAGAANMILIDLPAGGNPGTYGLGNGMTASVYAGMTNIAWDFHQYAWAFTSGTDNGQTGPGTISQATIQSQMLFNIGEAQTIPSADGVVPVIAGESGISTNGSSLDVSGYNLVGAVLANTTGASGYLSGSMFWHWGVIDAYNNLTVDTAGSALTSPYGTTIAAGI